MATYDGDDDQPLDPAADRLRRKMARLLLVSGSIMVLGFIAVFSAIVYKLGLLGETEEGAATSGSVVEARVAVPPGTRLVGTALDGNRALLSVEADGATSLILLDLASGRIVGRYLLQTP